MICSFLPKRYVRAYLKIPTSKNTDLANSAISSKKSLFGGQAPQKLFIAYKTGNESFHANLGAMAPKTSNCIPFRPPKLPEAVLDVLNRLARAGHEAYIVGGAPRDWIMGAPVYDYDVATSAHPGVVEKLFRHTVAVAAEHGTILIPRKDWCIEVTTFRRCTGTDSGFGSTIEEDLAARDFTINAMAWRLEPPELLDPFDGRADLDDRRLRAVGRPEARFEEDPLRVLRACRFVARFGLSVDAPTEKAMGQYVEACSACADERLTKEILRWLSLETPSFGLALAHRVGLLSQLFVRTPEPDLFAALDGVSSIMPIVRLALLGSTRQGLCLGRRDRTLLAALEAASPRPIPAPQCRAELRKWLSSIGPENTPSVLSLQLARGNINVQAYESLIVAVERELAEASPLSVAALAVNGQDVMVALGLKAGPAVGEVLESLLCLVIDEPSENVRERLLEHIELLKPR